MHPSPKSLARVFSILAALLALVATSALAAGPPPNRPPQAVVAGFLGLTESQRTDWAAIREAAGDAIAPLAEEVQEQEEALRELLESSNPDPAAVGALVLAIRHLRESIRGEQHDATGAFLDLLDGDQTVKLDRVRAAAPLCRVVPAFEAFHLLAPPA